MSYEIEKNIPIPAPAQNRKGAKSKYPWKEMEIGDSFFIPNPPKATKNGYFTNVAGVASRRLKMKFVQRAEGSGLRIWRVA